MELALVLVSQSHLRCLCHQLLKHAPRSALSDPDFIMPEEHEKLKWDVLRSKAQSAMAAL